jgi:hypothetical protein
MKIFLVFLLFFGTACCCSVFGQRRPRTPEQEAAREAKCPIVVVNAAHDEPINCAFGVVRDFEYVVSLPRKGEVIQTVQFTPQPKRPRPSQENRTR